MTDQAPPEARERLLTAATDRNGTSAGVVVVGAGLAGLLAAYRLQQAGVEVCVLEARDRVGGRLWSVSSGFTAGQHADLGGELVMGSYRLVPALCDELGVGLSQPVSYLRDGATHDETTLEALLAPGRFVVHREVLQGAGFSTVVQEIRQAIDATGPATHEAVEQWIRRARLSPTAAAVVRAAARMPSQTDPWELDGHYLFATTLGADIRRIRGGSDRLPAALAEHLDVRLETIVTAVRQGGGKVRLHTADGQVFVADRAVVAVPPLVVPSLGFDPLLPPHQANLASSWRPAVGGKIVAQYAEGDVVRSAFMRCVYSDGPLNTAWIGDTDVTTGPAVVAGFICGTQRGLLDTPEHAAAALDELVTTMIGARPTRIAQACKHWTPDPFSLNLAMIPAHGRWEAATACAARPHGRVHFAGDYTDDAFGPCMEGAGRSGERVADEILGLPHRVSLAEINGGMLIR